MTAEGGRWVHLARRRLREMARSHYQRRRDRPPVAVPSGRKSGEPDPV